MAEANKTENVSNDPTEGEDPTHDEQEGEDPTLAAYRNLILQMDQMENGEDEEEDGKDKNLDVSVKSVTTGDRAPLLLSAVQEENEILLGSHGPKSQLSKPFQMGRSSSPPPHGVRFSTPPPPRGRLSTPPPPGVPVNNRNVEKHKMDLVTSPSGYGSPIQGRTSPLTGASPVSSTRSSPRLLKGRVSPSPPVADDGNQNTDLQLENPSNERKISVHSIQVQPAPNGKTIHQTQKGTADAKDVKKSKTKKRKMSRIFVRAFEERASQENFALYGLLTPALCLVPNVDGVSVH